MAAVTGTIKRIVRDKGFGFVAAPDGNEYFFHQSACTGAKGPRAENIKPA
jgi:cold shock CspA family protein